MLFTISQSIPLTLQVARRFFKAKLCWLDSILGDLMLDEVTLDVIARIKTARLKDTSQSTCNRYLQLVRSILRMACYEWEWTERVPKVRLFQEPEGRVRFLTPEQVQALLHELPAHLADMALFALQTGLRKSNVTKLEWSAVGLVKHHAWVGAGQSKKPQGNIGSAQSRGYSGVAKATWQTSCAGLFLRRQANC